MRTAVPHLMHIGDNGRKMYVDMFIEKFGTGELPRKYERALVKFFKTKDKKEMLRRALRSKSAIILCPESKRIEIVDVASGELMKRFGRVAGMKFDKEEMKLSSIADRLTESLFVEEQGRHSSIVGVAPNAREAAISKRLAREGKIAISVARSLVFKKS